MGFGPIGPTLLAIPVYCVTPASTRDAINVLSPLELVSSVSHVNEFG